MSLSNIQSRQFLTIPEKIARFSKNAQCTIHLTLRKISAYLVVVLDWTTQKALCLRKMQTKIEAKQTENKERKIALQTIFCDLNLLMNETLPKMTNPVEIYNGNVLNSWTFYYFNSLTSFDIYAFAQKVIRIIHILIETNPHRIEQNIVVNATPRNRNDFSVPAWPVRMMLCPSRILSSTNFCSLVKEVIILDVDTIRCKNFRPIKCVTNATEDFRRIRRVRWMVHCAF